MRTTTAVRLRKRKIANSHAEVPSNMRCTCITTIICACTGVSGCVCVCVCKYACMHVGRYAYRKAGRYVVMQAGVRWWGGRYRSYVHLFRLVPLPPSLPPSLPLSLSSGLLHLHCFAHAFEEHREAHLHNPGSWVGILGAADPGALSAVDFEASRWGPFIFREGVAPWDLELRPPFVDPWVSGPSCFAEDSGGKVRVMSLLSSQYWQA